MKIFVRFAFIFFNVLFTSIAVDFKDNLAAQNKVNIPLAGNAYLTNTSQDSNDWIGRSGIQNWQAEETIYSVWFHVDRPAEISLALQLKVQEGKSEIKITTEGRSFRIRP